MGLRPSNLKDSAPDGAVVVTALPLLAVRSSLDKRGSSGILMPGTDMVSFLWSSVLSERIHNEQTTFIPTQAPHSV